MDGVRAIGRVGLRQEGLEVATQRAVQHGSLDPATSAKAHEAEKFAKMLARHLKDLHNEQHFEQLVLVAPPRFLGLLRKELHKPLGQLVTRTIDKDLTTAGVEEILGYIRS